MSGAAAPPGSDGSPESTPGASTPPAESSAPPAAPQPPPAPDEGRPDTEAAGEQRSDPRAPTPVLAAVRLMYLGAALSLLLGVLRLLDPDGFRDAVRDQSAPGSAGEFERMSADNQLAGYVVFAFLVAGIWLWVARGCRKGSSRAHLAATILGGLYVVLAAVALFQVSINASTVVSVVMMAVAAAVVWLLYTPESRRYVAAASTRR